MSRFSWKKQDYNDTPLPTLLLFYYSYLGSLLLYFDVTQNVNVNPGFSHFEQRTLACTRLLANLHLHFAFRQSKAMLPLCTFSKQMRL